MRFIKSLLLICVLCNLSRVSSAQSETLRILPLGNSLTYGYYDGSQLAGDCIGYRYELYTLLNNAGYNFNMIGHQNSGYNYFSDSQNAGISGIKDEQLASVVANGYYYNNSVKINVTNPNQPYLNVYPSDIILLEIGTNDWIKDEYNSYQVAQLNTLFNAVDAYEIANNTEVLIIAARIITKKNGLHACEMPLAEWRVDYYNDALEGIVNTRISAGDKIKFIDLQCGAGIDYTTDMLNDYHPNQTGYNKMGQKWFAEINNINAAPVLTSITTTPVPEATAFAPINLDSYVSDDHSTDANITWTVSPAPVHYSVSIVNRIATVTQVDPYWNGTENITFIATDQGYYIEKLKKSSSQSVSFTTIPVNNIPEVISQVTTFDLLEDSFFEITINDLQIQDDNNPVDWTLNILPGANYSTDGNNIIPEQDLTGQLNVSITVSDNANESEVFNVIANFSPINDAPVISGVNNIMMNEDQDKEISLSDVIYTDPDNIAGDISLYVLNGLNYTVNGHIISPSPNFNGELQVGIRLRDNTAYSNVYNFTIMCESVNDPPEITSSPITPWNDHIAYEYHITALDVDTDEITFSPSSVPAWLDLDPETGLLSGTPGNSDIGINPITIGVFDGTITTLHSFNLQIIDANNAPSFTNQADTLADINAVYNWTAYANDFDEDDIVFIPVKIPYFLTFLSESGTLTGTPAPINEGIHVVRIGASDGIDTTVMQFLLYVGNYTSIPVNISNAFQVFPNPANAEINILMSEPVQNPEIKIVNLTGSVIANYKHLDFADNNSAILDISEIDAGAYILVISIDQKIYTQRLLIVRSIF